MNNNPFFSIVIANYNYGKSLPMALDSIFSQDCDDYEVIIVDGGSTDNSVEVIKRYEEKLSWWVSEPDKGQSNAFNKGFSHANGQFLTWLNADDIYLPGTLSAVKKALLSKPTASYATGNFVRFDDESGLITEAKWGPNVLPYWLQGQGRVSIAYGPTTFWKRSVCEKLGPFDESLYFIMDSDYWVRLMLAGYKQVRVHHYCWAFRMHMDSKTAMNMTPEKLKRLREERAYSMIKNGYRITLFWRIIGFLFRAMDLSLIKSVLNQLCIRGKNLRSYFGVEHNI